MNSIDERYDAASDADTLSEPLTQWAKIGFLRGFSGFRKEIVPEGEMILPSKAFSEVAWQRIGQESIDAGEYEKRVSYISEMEENLRRIQSEVIHEHYRNSIWGHVCDFILALVFVGLIAGLMIRVGPYSHLTLALLAMIGAKIIFLQVSVKRAIRIAQSAFKFDRSRITLPWERGSAGRAD